MSERNTGNHKPRYILVVIAVFLVLQFGIPLAQMAQEGSQRWGWQMYSRAPGFGDYSIVTEDGDTREIDMNEHLSFWRFELKPNEQLMSQLCHREPDAIAVKVQHDGSARVDELACSGR